jgi:Zn-dependent peptidase ImmA (M78 family)
MAETMYIKLNPQILVWARETLALTRNQAAEKTGISLKRLSQLEQGDRQPTIEELRLLSKEYKRTIATLLLSEPPKEKPLPKDRRTVDSRSIDNFHFKTIIAVRKARALAHSFVELRQELGLDIPKLSLKASITDNPKVVAADIRKGLRLAEIREIQKTEHALDAYIEKVESLGVAVFQLSLTQDRIRGFSLADDIIPIIGIKRGQEAPYSKIFTLFHELGHILLNEGGLCDLSFNTNIEIEKWCNSFSAEILIPTTELMKQESVVNHKINANKIWSKMELISLGNKFHVGPLAILRSLLENSLTSKSFYNEKHQAWNKPQFGRAKEPKGRELHKESLQERGRTYVALAFSAFDQNRIDLKDLSDFLGLKLSYIPKTRQLLRAI